jgi:hypothetical protein
MATWVIFLSDDDGRQVLEYRNLRTGQRYECGRASRLVVEQVFINWVIEVGQPSPGDFIIFEESGRVHQYIVNPSASA